MSVGRAEHGLQDFFEDLIAGTFGQP